jgi:hypothetical protein
MMFLGSRARPVSRTDNLATICEPIVYTCGIFNISQHYRPPRSATEIALPFFCYSTLNLDVTCSSETSVCFQRITRNYIPESTTFYNNRYEILKSYVGSVWFCHCWFCFQSFSMKSACFRRNRWKCVLRHLRYLCSSVKRSEYFRSDIVCVTFDVSECGHNITCRHPEYRVSAYIWTELD